MPEALTQQQNFLDATSYIIVGVIFLVFGWRVLSIHKKYPSPLTEGFAGFDLMAGLGFLVNGLVTLFTIRTVSVGYDVILSTPLFCVAVAYLTKPVWHILFPSRSVRPVFWLFCGMGLVYGVLAVLQKFGYGNYDLVATIISFILAAFVLITGAVIVRYGSSSASRKRVIILGASLIGGGIIGGATTYVAYRNPLIAVGLSLLLVFTHALGLFGIMGAAHQSTGVQ